jgi:hypothetical protein
MLRFWRRKSRLGSIDQPDDVELLSYLDGQLVPERHAEIEKLKGESWEIRLRLAELKRDIETYTEATRHLVPDEIPPFGEFWKGVPIETPSPHQAEQGSASSANRKTGQENNGFSFSRRLGWLWPVPLPSARLTAALVLLFVVVVVFVIRISLAPPVSAKELMKLTIRAEEQRIHVVTAPVIYQKLRVHRKSQGPGDEDTATWEIWNDATNRRFRQRVEDTGGLPSVSPQGKDVIPSGQPHSRSEGSPEVSQTVSTASTMQGSSDESALPSVLRELGQIYSANRMDQRRPLSPAAFQAWQSHIPNRTDKVTEEEMTEGYRAFVLTSEAAGPFPLRAIVRGELVVRSTDWHPVEQRLKVQGTQGVQDYQVTESAFQVLALNALDPAVFAGFSPPLPPESMVSAPSASLSELPNPADLLTAEIEAHYAIHRAKACLGESIEVVPNPKGKIEVRGLAASAEQKEDLQTELRKVPFVSLKIQTIAEAMKAGSLPGPPPGQSKANAPSGASSEPTITVQPPQLPIQEQLERYIVKKQSAASADGNLNVSLKIAELSTEAVSQSRWVLSNAWALRRLAEGFGPARAQNMRIHSKRLLEAMVRDHVQAIQTHLGHSQSLLGPILSFCLEGPAPSVSSKPVESPDQPPLAGSNWADRSLLIFRDAEQMDFLTNGLFTGAELPTNGAQQAARDLLSIYDAMASRCQSLERMVAKDLSGNLSQLSMQEQVE